MIYTLSCQHCSVIFTVDLRSRTAKYRNPPRKFCSRKCQDANNKRINVKKRAIRNSDAYAKALIKSKTIIDPASGCWVWQGPKTPLNYGRTSFRGKIEHTHRMAYILWVGSIPDGLELDHLCRNPICCNPAHLEAVTRLENIRRRPYTLKSHCRIGHEFTPENTYIAPKTGYRFCRKCCADYHRRRYHAKRTA